MHFKLKLRFPTDIFIETLTLAHLSEELIIKKNHLKSKSNAEFGIYFCFMFAE